MFNTRSDTLSLSKGVSGRLTATLWPQNDVERNIWRANVLAAGFVALLAAGAWIWARLVSGPQGQGMTIGNAVGLAMLCTGIPHYVIAFLFLVTSPANRTPHRRVRLVAACTVAVALCGLYAVMGGPPLPGASVYLRGLDGSFSARALPLLSLVAVYVFFLAHELTDQTSFLRKMRREDVGAERLVLRLLLPASVVLLATAGWVVTALGAYDNTQAFLPEGAPLSVRLTVAIVPLVIVAAALATLRERWTPLGAEMRRTVIRLWPELRVCLLTISVIIVGLIVTQRAYWMFLPHFAVWYLVARQKLAESAPPTAGWWRWLRSTRIGFLVLYSSLAAIVLLVVASSSPHATAPGASLPGAIFVQATVFHITVSMMMPRSGG